MLFDTVLIANRGEIALRVIRTCNRLGIGTVAVYSDADAGAAHVAAATRAVRLGPAPARESYLDIEKVIAAARATGAQAIHPGYGFLSENAAFAAACEEAGIVFLGPSSQAITTMGDKITAKRAVAAHGVPLVPGIAEAGLSDADLVAAAGDIGFPVLVKPSAGGGGKGMRAVADPAELPAALASARREAAASFGDDTLFLERLVSTPRHIEVQILADAHGGVVHLGERECSLQRRHQKVVEEAPSVLLDEETRVRIGRAACDTARSVAYTGAGTVEFIVGADDPEEFFFMEMNTRLQVEHPVTEEAYGVDLVEWQLRIGAGQELDLVQSELVPRRHSIECRIYAEDPARGFLPTGGTALDVRIPQRTGIRFDGGVSSGQAIVSDYDPMIGKLITTAATRAEALDLMAGALRESAVPGIVTNIDFLTDLVSRGYVRAGDIDTGLIDRMAAGTDDGSVPGPQAAEADWLLAAAALVDAAAENSPTSPEPPTAWQRRSAWRPSAPPVTRLRLAHDGRTRTIALDVSQTARRADGAGVLRTITVDGIDERGTTWTTRALDARAGREAIRIWVRSPRGVLRFAQALADPHVGGTDSGAEVVAPMPGSVIEIRVADGDAVAAGQALLVVEAMKMEHVLSAPTEGIVRLHTTAGAQVALDELLASVGAADDDEDGDES